MKDFEDHCQVFQVYVRCEGKLQQGFKPETGVMAIYCSKKSSSLAHRQVSDSAFLNLFLGIF